jgi:hydroxymethylglutaryl-CoA lyase
MKLALPDNVTLIEVGPRDGFQFETQIIPTDIKIEIIAALIGAGLRHIQVASFVHPRKVPQMADAEDLIGRLPSVDDVEFSGLVLNTNGVRRAQTAGLRHIEISVSASDTHSRNNSGMPLKEAVGQAAEMIRLARSGRMHIRAGVQCAFGCAYEGHVPPERVRDIVRRYLAHGIDAVALSDTTGMANPAAVARLLEQLLPELGSIPVILHFHDTRGLGLANVLAALQCSVTCFDTALAGMGGCPFVPEAAGNIATEDTAHLMHAMGIATGIDINRVAECSLRLETLLNKTFPGKAHRMRL